MPRLRYYKRFEAINENEQRDEERFELSGQSWWSNRNIITGLSDTKIKQAIGYHKQMAKMLEAELCCRINGTRTYIRPIEYHGSVFREYSEQRLDETIYKEKRNLAPSLRRIVKTIKKNHGITTAEKVKKEWEIILQQYRKGA